MSELNWDRPGFDATGDVATEDRQPLHLLLKKGGPLVPVILAFRGEYRFLSNFQEADIYMDAECVPCADGSSVTFRDMLFENSEAAYMAWKTTSADYRYALLTMKGSEAKKLSRTEDFKATHRADYNDTTRVVAMYRILQRKFSVRYSPELVGKLLDTDNACLIEGVTWDDDLFGFHLDTGMGPNFLGRILMTIRDELRVVHGLAPMLPKAVLPDDILNAPWPLYAAKW